jgi:hypothetical protein
LSLRWVFSRSNSWKSQGATNAFMTSPAIWINPNSSKDFSNSVWSFELFLFYALFGFGSDIWVVSLSMVISYCFLPGFHPIGVIRVLFLSLMSRLSFWDGKVLHIMFSVPLEAFSTWREHRVVTNNFPCFQKIWLLWAMIWLISYCLITGHCLLFAYVVKFPRFVTFVILLQQK